MVLEDRFLLLHFLPFHPYFCPSIFVFTRPNDGWMGLYIKLWHVHHYNNGYDVVSHGSGECWLVGCRRSWRRTGHTTRPSQSCTKVSASKPLFHLTSRLICVHPALPSMLTCASMATQPTSTVQVITPPPTASVVSIRPSVRQSIHPSVRLSPLMVLSVMALSHRVSQLRTQIFLN